MTWLDRHLQLQLQLQF